MIKSLMPMLSVIQYEVGQKVGWAMMTLMVLREFKVKALIKAAMWHSCSSTTSKIKLTMLCTML